MGAAAAPLAPRRAAAICSRGARNAQRHILFRRARREARGGGGGAASPRMRPLKKKKKKDGPRGFVPKGEKEAKNTRAQKKQKNITFSLLREAEGEWRRGGREGG